MSAVSRWLGRGLSRPKRPKTRRALGTYPAAGRQAFGAGHGRPALALPHPSAERGNLNRPSSAPRPRRRDTAQGPGCSYSGWSVYPSSGFSKHTFVSTHATGARTHAPRVRAHSPAGCRRRARDARLRRAAASALSAHLDLRPGSAGCGAVGSLGSPDVRRAHCGAGGARTTHPPLDRQLGEKAIEND